MNLMKKVLLTVGLLASATAFASDEAPAGSTMVANPQAAYFTQDGKVKVQQFLWNECIHCYKLEPYVDQWNKVNADYIDFEQIPVAWSEKHIKDGSFYNYAKTLRKTGKINEQELVDINNELFKVGVVERKGLKSETVFPIFEKYGIKSADELDKAVNSFVTANEISKSKKLTKDYEIEGVPVFVIAGKYLVSFQSIKEATPVELFSTIDRIAETEHKNSIGTVKQDETVAKETTKTVEAVKK